ncbi:hypothetical protein BT63DRAFT_426653 [Microthyrium microscopicum]|uniref:Uncharacterized protein n=1 Tax=Microthyrium microscopicum TaxID=703497 RepID=A0A6A6U833_9PEZI|nr:hypothetical protein BT63DRAFT_426653 [Microthyrium microscopicum]
MKTSQYVCRVCRTIRSPIRTSIFSRAPVFTTSPARRKFSTTPALPLAAVAIPIPQKSKKATQTKGFWGNDWTVFSADNAALVKKAQVLGDAILQDPTAPSEEEVLKTLEFIKYAALQLNTPQQAVQLPKEFQEDSDDSQISKKDVTSNPNVMADMLTNLRKNTKAPASTTVSLSIATKLLSTLAYKIIIHPPVFLSAKILESYVAIQTTLLELSTLPEVFDLYAHKPTPEPNSSPIKYIDPNPNKIQQAIPEALAERALDVAIRNRELTLSLDIISATYSTKAFRRNKFFRKALPLIGGLTLTPFVALSAAQSWAKTSMTADPRELAFYGFLGIITYIGTLSGLGYIALATYNDQMRRVTWIPGMPLRIRWMREEERAAADKVVVAWGFKEEARRGEEEGEEWELLKEWCGQRGMLIDASELMDDASFED